MLKALGHIFWVLIFASINFDHHHYMKSRVLPWDRDGDKRKGKGKLRGNKIIPSPDSCFHITCTRNIFFACTPGKLFKRQMALFQMNHHYSVARIVFRITNYIIYCKLRPFEPKQNYFWDTPTLSQGQDDCPLPPYLKV